MKNILKAWLKKNQQSIDQTDYTAMVDIKGNLGLTDIVDELLKEGLEINREVALDIITRFNRKSADLALSGYQVNNGLVNMRPTIKGTLIGGTWNPAVNWVDVAITHGNDLYKAVAETTVEIVGDKDEMIQRFNLSDKSAQSTGRFQSKVRAKETNGRQLKTTGEPACGMAFRQWLCKA
ncbi:MAG: DNA-binding domain-containing protein [Bacteroidota bacterium]|nr:DNA-binding domain-containing protein [Bacteroidota bacterium]